MPTYADSELAEVTFDDLIHFTDDAWLILFEGREVWIPKEHSVMEEDDRTVYVAEWLAVKEGLV